MDKNTPTIIVCIDTGNSAGIALRYACHKAKTSNLTVSILSVMENSHKNLLFGSRAIGYEKRQELEKALKKLIDIAQNETGVIPAVSIREGDIASEIIREVKSNPNCSMLVFGKSYNSMSDNTVLPKIMQKVGRKIRVPIVVVPENLDEELLKKLV